MNCIIEGIDFYNLDAMRYYSPPNSWSQEKIKDNVTSKIFSGNWLGSQKRDGTFSLFGKNLEGEIFLRPRAKNVKGEYVNKIDWVPQFKSVIEQLDPGTVMLGEIYLPRDEQAKTTTSILNCLLPKSLARQEIEDNKLHLYIFDILAENGKSYLNMRAEDRFNLLESFSRAYPSRYVEWAHYVEGKELWNTLQNLLADGYEGMVITYKDAHYEPGKRSSKVSLKVKKELQDTIDCVIMSALPPRKDYTGIEIRTWPYWYDEMTDEKIYGEFYDDYANGRAIMPVTKTWFNGWAGSLKLGAYKNGQLVSIGQLSGITDEIKENWHDYIGKVCEITAMEIMDTKGIRHPKFCRWRDDIDPADCTWERIFGE